MSYKVDTTGLPCVATNHAKDRLEQIGLDFRKAVYMFHNGIEEKAAHKGMKLKKYGDRPDIRYRVYGTILFTYKIQERKRREVLFITVTDKMINLKSMDI